MLIGILYEFQINFIEFTDIKEWNHIKLINIEKSPWTVKKEVKID